MVTPRRTPAAAPTRRAAQPARTAPTRSSGYRGAAVYAAMEEEDKRAEARKEAQAQMANAPFRFYCPVGETREIVVIDDAPDFVRYEHNLKNSRTGKWDIYTACVNDHANCPVCAGSERPPYFAMYLTVLDLTPYVNKDGIEVPWSKKLLVVKPQQQKKIMRIHQREGSLRGVVLSMTRDGDKDASIGNDIDYVETFDEDMLAEYMDEYTDKKNVVHQVVGNEVFDYDELFPEPTEESLRAIVGGSPEPGSRESDRRATRGTDDWDRNGGGDRPAVRRRPPAAAPAPAARGPVRRAAPAADTYDADDQDAQDDTQDPPPRVAIRRGAPAAREAVPARTAPARRAPMREQEPEDPEDPPQRGAATSLAERRRLLRR